LTNAGIGNRAKFGYPTLALKGSRKWLPDVGASISLALDER
jgi:hypothetical protein